MKKARFVKAAVAVLSLSFVLATPANAVDLAGSGASFPAALIEGCKAGFAKSTTHTYQYLSDSSGFGQRQAIAGTGNFWFSDGVFPAATKPATMKHAPIVAGPIGILYNLNGNAGKTLSLSAATIADIFAGKITKWNDPAIVKDANRTVTTTTYVTKNGVIVKNADGTNKVLRTKTTKISFTLPNRPIKVVYRSDNSGSTTNFVAYLKGAPATDLGWTQSGTFTTAIAGTGKTVNDAGNLGRYVGRGNSLGVANEVKGTVDSIGYAEPSYAGGASRVASVYNASGSLVDPLTPGAVASFLAAAQTGSAETTYSGVGGTAEGTYKFNYKTTEKGAYPISIVSYLVFDTAYSSAATAAAVKELANYILSPACAQDVGAAFGFAVITGSAKATAEKMIAQIGSK
jgi:phosphate transport system substrate-binding protein